jgi:hypothetical protein
MAADPMNIPLVSVAAAKAALLEQFADPVLRRRATMLWGTRGVGKSSIVRQVAHTHRVPLIDLRLTTIEPVDLRGAIYADEVQARTVWFPPEFLPGPDQPSGILFLDELTAADQRLQISAYSLILDRRVGQYRLPDGWLVVAAGNAAHHGAITHDMGTALADRMFHFHVQATIDAFMAHALAEGFAPEVMAYLKVRPDRLDDTASWRPTIWWVPARAAGRTSRACCNRVSPSRRGDCSCKAASGRPTRRSSSGCCANCRPRWTCWHCCAPRPGQRPPLCCRAPWMVCTACCTA